MWNQNILQNIDFSAPGHETFSDFEIICIDQKKNGDEQEKRFRCHKIILYLSSTYYKNMFSGKFIENELGVTKVTDVSSKTMEKVLQYLYTCQFKKDDMDIDVLYAADKYGIGYLHSACELELATNLTTETASDIALAANLCGSETFKSYVFGYVRKHWTQLKDSGNTDLLNKNPSVLREVLDKTYSDK